MYLPVPRTFHWSQLDATAVTQISLSFLHFSLFHLWPLFLIVYKPVMSVVSSLVNTITTPLTSLVRPSSVNPLWCRNCHWLSTHHYLTNCSLSHSIPCCGEDSNELLSLLDELANYPDALDYSEFSDPTAERSRSFRESRWWNPGNESCIGGSWLPGWQQKLGYWRVLPDCSSCNRVLFIVLSTLHYHPEVLPLLLHISKALEWDSARNLMYNLNQFYRVTDSLQNIPRLKLKHVTNYGTSCNRLL